MGEDDDLDVIPLFVAPILFPPDYSERRPSMASKKAADKAKDKKKGK